MPDKANKMLKTNKSEMVTMRNESKAIKWKLDIRKCTKRKKKIKRKVKTEKQKHRKGRQERENKDVVDTPRKKDRQQRDRQNINLNLEYINSRPSVCQQIVRLSFVKQTDRQTDRAKTAPAQNLKL